MTYPAAPIGDDADLLTGPAGPVSIPDPYRWLEDPSSAASAAWSQAQKELFERHQRSWPARGHFRARVSELLGSGSVGVPAWRGRRQFLTRRRPDQEHAVLLVIEADGSERVLLDPMDLDAGGRTTLDAWQPSKEGLLVAIQSSHGGSEESVLSILDVETGATVDGPIDRARYSPVAWLPGATSQAGAFYYVRRLPPQDLPIDERQFHRRVWLHRLGTPPESDVEVFGAGRDPRTYYGCSVSRDGRWLSISASVGTQPRTDNWLADLSEAALEHPPLVTVQEGVDAQASLHVGRDGRLYVWTDRDAPRGRLCVGDPAYPTAEHWRDLVAEDPVAVLEDFAVLDGPELSAPRLLVSRSRHALSELTVHDLGNGAALDTIELPGIGTVGGLAERPEGGAHSWFGWTSYTEPVTVYQYDARDGALTVWARPPGAVEVPAVRARQHAYRSADGTTVRLVLIAGADEPDVARPTILYGYGGFGQAMTPGFSAGVLAWVEAGGAYAVAALRGGGEEGEQWHRAGMLGEKARTFEDLHAGAEWLIEHGWATPATLGISGGSNGGLLVGAALTQRPDLYRSVVCSAPLLDMVRYEQFGLGATWNVEYGSASVPQELGWLLDYSPYHHVRQATRYPAVLFTVFDGDTRVDPMHARKMCAALQAATGSPESTAPILLRAEVDVGHGARAISRTVDLAADTLAFQAAMLGLHPVHAAGRAFEADRASAPTVVEARPATYG